MPGVRLHDLRHSAATWALAGGSDVRSVSAIWGTARHLRPLTSMDTSSRDSRAFRIASVGDTLSRAQARRLEVKKAGLAAAEGNQMATGAQIGGLAVAAGEAQTKVG